VPLLLRRPQGLLHRLAHGDAIEGPRIIHEPGSLQLVDSGFLVEDLVIDAETFERITTRYREALDDQMPASLRDDLLTAHIASPDVHVDDDRHEIVMYLHGSEALGDQRTRVAVSSDGTHFQAAPETYGPSYFRCFRHNGCWHALAMPGRFFRSRDGRTGFEEGLTLFGPDMRHSAVRVVEGAAGAELEVS
tara:strand:+ start:631 stop:1203 length:573 start_codon:yes stop_codon:yes gene_type:complete